MESLNLTLLIDWALRIVQIITFIGVILKIIIIMDIQIM